MELMDLNSYKSFWYWD